MTSTALFFQLPMAYSTPFSFGLHRPVWEK